VEIEGRFPEERKRPYFVGKFSGESGSVLTVLGRFNEKREILQLGWGATAFIGKEKIELTLFRTA
jgi:hypothetical protein